MVANVERSNQNQFMGRTEPTRDDAEPQPSWEDQLDALFEEYLGLLESGEVLPPGPFLESRGETDPRVARHLESLFSRVQRRDASRSGAASVQTGTLERLGPFRLLERIGSGGMGDIYLAEEEPLERLVALKVIRRDFSDSTTARARFEREARAIARLRHPGIVTVFRSGESLGVRYIAMEHVPGRGLDEILDDGEPVELPTLLRWGAEVARALDYAHEQGIVHRDVKPSNVLIGTDGAARLVDFGLARDLTREEATLTQSFVGSPTYAAPEQISHDGDPVDGRVDLYALGALLYRGIAGRPPFDSGPVEQVFHQVLHHDPPPLPRSTPRAVEIVVRKCLEKKPHHRYGQASQLADDLEAILAFRPIRARAPHLLRRGFRFARRHPVVTAGTFAFLAVVLVFSAVLITQTVERRRERNLAAVTALERAERAVEEYTQVVESTGPVLQKYRTFNWTMARYFPTELEAQLEAVEVQAEMARQQRVTAFLAAQQLLGEARRQGSPAAPIHAAFARLYSRRAEVASEDGDALARQRFKLQAETYRETPPPPVTTASVITSSPPGAKVFVYPLREVRELVPGGPRRIVPALPPDVTPPIAPGAWVLRVNQAAGSLEEGDLILEVAGHEIEGTVLVSRGGHGIRPFDRLLTVDELPVRSLYDVEHLARAAPGPAGAAVQKSFAFLRGQERITVKGPGLDILGIEISTPRDAVSLGGARGRVWRGGRIEETDLPPGLSVRTDAAAVFLHPGAYVGTTPLDLVLEERHQLIVLRRPGYEEVRIEVSDLAPLPAGITRTLLPEGTTPPGFVRTQENEWLQEYEVTSVEYLEFLNSPEARGAMEGSTVARQPRNDEAPLWPRTPDGSFQLPANQPPDWPVTGVSWHDAVAFARWRTERAAARSEPFVFDLPSGARDALVYGPVFRPKWMSSCFSRPKPTLEPVGSYPIDRWILGPADLHGSVAEWTSSQYGGRSDRRFRAGGSWADHDPIHLFWSGMGLPPESTRNDTGFRLRARRIEAATEVTQTLRVEASPSPARIHLFRLTQVPDPHTGGRRTAALPFGPHGESTAGPAGWAYRVLRPGGSLESNDLIIEVNGRSAREHWLRSGDGGPRHGSGLAGEPARIWRDGQMIDTRLPSDLECQATAMPLFLGPASLLGQGSIETPLPTGRYLLVAEAEGLETVRWPLVVRAGEDARVHLRLTTEQPDHGLVRINFAPRWMMRREVTLGEYVEFLNDRGPRSRSGFDLVPRVEGGRFLVHQGGRFQLPPELHPDLPAFGVTWHAAQEYARWKTEQFADRDPPPIFELPSRADWEWVRPSSPRYVFGEECREGWVACALGAASPGPERVMSYPIDESPLGIFDLDGSVREWIRDLDPVYGRPWCLGWSWKDPELLDRGSRRQFVRWPEASSEAIGFRLIAYEGRGR